MHSKELLKWIFDIDDPNLFLKAIGENNLFNSEIYRREESDEFFEAIVGTNRIFEALCDERTYPEKELKYMPTLLFEILKYSLHKNDNVKAQRIISAYTKFLEDQIEAFRNETNIESNQKFGAQGINQVQTGIYYGKSLVMLAWNFGELDEKYDGFDDQIEYLKISNIIERLLVKNLSAMQYGDSFVKDGIYYVKMKPDLSLEALKYLTKEKGSEFLPTYIGEEEGVVKIRAYRNGISKIELKELGTMLGEIHSLSMEKMGKDKVYMYSGGFENGFGCMTYSSKKIITNWTVCEIGTPINDIVIALLNSYGCDIYNNYAFVVRDSQKAYEELLQFLNTYPDKKVIENFGDKLNEELDKILNRVKNNVNTKDPKYIFHLHSMKGFAEIYCQNLNDITQLRNECEGI